MTTRINDLTPEDGWGFHAWHGTRIPAWVVENPTVEQAMKEPNSEIRRVEGDWAAVKPGQRVWLVSTDTTAPKIEGIVSAADSPAYITIRGLGYTQFQSGYWNLFVEAPAPEPFVLPSEPGLYRLDNQMVVEFTGRDWLSPDHMNYVTSYAERSLTFTRLDPKADTVREVLERVASVWEFGPPASWVKELNDIGEEFGVPL